MIYGHLYNATFYGGPGRDSAVVADCGTSNVLYGVESTSDYVCP